MISRKNGVRSSLQEILAKFSEGSENDQLSVVFSRPSLPSVDCSQHDLTAISEHDTSQEQEQDNSQPTISAEETAKHKPVAEAHRDISAGEGDGGKVEPRDRRKVKENKEQIYESPSPEKLPKVDEKKTKEKGLDPQKEASRRLRQTQRQWVQAQFSVTELVGHNDLVCGVSVCGDRLLTGSRDTTVKLWNLESCAEIASLGGHTGCVNAVCLLTETQSHHIVDALGHDFHSDHQGAPSIGISGSSDCSVNIWCLRTGQLVKSIYLFNPVLCVACVQCSNSRLLIVAGLGGGKIEIVDPGSGSIVQSVRGEEEAITCVKVWDKYVYSASADGVLKVFEMREETMHLIFESENIKSVTGAELPWRHIRSLAAANQILYYGDDAMNIKALDWKLGVVHKLSNHTTDFGSTDALCACADVLLASGYDIDNGLGFINVRHLPDEKYLCSLCDEDTSRIVCIDCHRNHGDKPGEVVIVTGGMELKVWRKTATAQSESGEKNVLEAQFVPHFDRAARNSDMESDDDTDNATSEPDSLDASVEDLAGPMAAPFSPRNHGNESDGRGGWMSWCNLV